MVVHPKPIGENGSPSLEPLTTHLRQALRQAPALWEPDTQRLIADLVSAAVSVGVDVDTACATADAICAASPAAAAPRVLFARIAESLATQGAANAAEAILARATSPSCSDDDDVAGRAWLLGARARALHVLGDGAGRDEAFSSARSLMRQGQRIHPGRLAADHLVVGNFAGALDVVRSTRRIPAGELSELYREIIAQSYAAERLSLGLEVLHLADDLIMQHRLLRDLLALPLAAGDGDSVLQLVSAAPIAYQGDLLAYAVPRLVAAGLHRAARDAVALWEAAESTSLLRLGAQGLVSDPGPPLAALHEALALRLEQEEELGIVDAWAYRELGQAFGWLGALGAALSALERVADHDDRLKALLAAARHAPVGVSEALICAARGLVASLEDESRRVRASVRLAAMLAQQGRRAEARQLFDDALQTADGIRRPRSDQGQTRRAALLVVTRAQQEVGEHVGAYNAGRKLRTRRHQNPSLRASAVAYAQAGDLSGACCYLDAMVSGLGQVRAVQQAAAAWLAAGQPLQAVDSDAA